jgi:hypothetical protein
MNVLTMLSRQKVIVEPAICSKLNAESNPMIIPNFLKRISLQVTNSVANSSWQVFPGLQIRFDGNIGG